LTKPVDLIRQAYSAFLFWKWDRAAEVARKRIRGCAHTRTMFVDVGSQPYDCVEKCRDCWALRLPKLGEEWPTKKLEWTPNTANPRRAIQVSAPRKTRVQP